MEPVKGTEMGNEIEPYIRAGIVSGLNLEKFYLKKDLTGKWYLSLNWNCDYVRV